MRKERFKRILAFYLAINIFFEVVSPTAALALTSGPGQPEMSSFEPVGTTEMVDVFSGDFNYNIPLLTVPGPNGGYPVNLAYHAGIGMEDEASWVGLGWNINPGTITRNMRGLPDDFNGETVNKKMTIRPNRSVGINFGFPFASAPEAVGFKAKQTLKLGLAWNNYRGFGFAGGYSLSYSSNKSTSFSPNASLDYNSLSGETNLSAGVSLASKSEFENKKFGLTANLNSLHGLKSFNFSYEKSSIHHFSTSSGREDDMAVERPSGGISFASPAFVPPSQMPQTGFNVSTSLSLGFNSVGIDNRFQINASYSQTKNDKDELDFKSYGYLYSNNRVASMPVYGEDNDNYKLMDFNREKDVVPTKDIPTMPVPIATYDVYMATGQGVGGAFRPFRSDIGLLLDPEIKGDNVGGNLGVEVGVGYPSMNFGLNLALNYSKSYTGPWHKPDLWNDIHSRMNKGYTYFKAAGEMVANEDDEADLEMDYKPFPITSMVSVPDFSDLSIDPSEMAEMMSPLVDVRVNNTGGIIGSKDHYNTRRTRSNLMSYKTFGEINAIPNYQSSWVNRSVYAENANPLTTANLTNSSGGFQSQIGEVSVTNPDGNRYIYALPAKNIVQKEVSFSIVKNGSNRNSPDEKIINYDPGVDNSTGNKQADDHFFSSTELPSYVHSYLLTAIVSPDYVDLTGNGLSDDDFGYWVKFNYTKTASNYKWRAPYSGANYLKGYLSSDNDDKAGYTYGEKEIWYLNSIETKSHIARFELQNRFDGKPPVSEDVSYTGAVNTSAMDAASTALKSLKKISLYSKTNPDVAVKEVHFDYTYDLCRNALNSSAPGTNGKLTLNKVWFTYMGNSKGSLSPYSFDYHQTTATGLTEENPDYSILQEDRWGNFKENSYGLDNTLFPYVPQSDFYDSDNVINDTDVKKRNAHASAWTLKEIKLPSGGSIIVDYEADDYAYVHDKPAMEMVRVVGFAQSPSNTSNIMMDMNAQNEYLFFEVNDHQFVNSTNVKNYFEGIEQIYFKMYIDLKKNGIAGVPKKDYVSGYAKIDANDCGLASSSYPGLQGRTIKLGYVKVNKVSIHDVPSGFPYTHPFRKAAWQYLKLERPDILYPSSNNSNSSGGAGLQFLTQMANSIIGLMQSSTQLFTGFYSYCQAAGFGQMMSTDKPSFIRVNSPDGIKYGGGHRVKRIKISDTWQESKPIKPTGEEPSVYGQEYSYRLTDGRSSGVATYEPLIGGEEIPHRMPIRYSSDYFIFKNQNLYVEEPVGESYYPGASVGYSRVVVKNIRQNVNASSNTEVTKTKEGTTVYQFYTNKDFPYSMTRSSLDPGNHEKFNPKITIPFVGSLSFENHAFSQWIKVVTNDMHGKPRSVSTFDATVDHNDPNKLPVTKIEYLYNVGPRGEVNSEVEVLYQDGDHRKANMGKTTEQYIDARENFAVSMNQGMQANLYLYIAGFVPIPIFVPLPIIDYSESLNKSIVAMHVTNQSGILMKTKAYNNGNVITSENLMFDAYTGQPLLTTVTNNFDKPVYNYNYAAQWVHQGMASAYKNDRAAFLFSTTGSGDLHLFSGSTYDLLYPGDEILVTGSGISTPVRAWVKTISNGTDAVLIKENGSNALGNSLSNLEGLVIRSGRRNQQAVSNAYIQSLTDPIGSRTFQLFEDYNNSTGNPFSSTDCGSNELLSYAKVYTNTASNSIIKLNYTNANPEKTCSVTMTFPLSTTINWTTVDLKKVGPSVLALDPTTHQVLSKGVIDDQCGLTECLDGVLNATAVEFKDRGWVYDYANAGDPVVNTTSALPHISAAVAASVRNPYKLGLAGIWRLEKAYVYQTERKQTINSNVNQTKIQDDGTFKQFALFSWTKPTNTNIQTNTTWTKANEVTKYSPYGFEIENKDALNISSAALYGYNNTLQTAIAQNARYNEIAFEGFEDHGSNTTYTSYNGHVKLVPYTPSSGNLSSNAHTGRKSLEIATGQKYVLNIPVSFSSSYYYFQPDNDLNPAYGYNSGRYVVSAWFKTSSGGRPIINPVGVNGTITVDPVVIEGWQRVELDFSMPNSSAARALEFYVSNTSASAYLDDIRIQPYKSTMKTYVYDPNTLWLKAELDNQNYATFYNYDEEGILTQVKKETVKGIQTLKTSRSNVKRITP